jgi:chromate reductase, NAD(P)H dehydrogenase (quinone)
MITVIQATNRPDSNTEFVSRHIGQLLTGQYQGKVGYISMGDLPPEILLSDSYEESDMPEKLRNIQDEWMVPAEKFIWILPEYNGSFPGILKLFIDALSVRKYDETFRLKKSMLIGIATGRSGNIRGMDHLTGILLHMKSVIYPRLLPISKVSELMDERGRINHAPTLKTLEDHLKGFIAF